MMAPDHPVWKLLRLVVVCVTLVILCSVLYKNGFDKKDIVMIGTTLLALAGYDQAKSVLTNNKDTSNG